MNETELNADFQQANRYLDEILGSRTHITRKITEDIISIFLRNLAARLKEFKMYVPEFDLEGLNKGTYDAGKLAAQIFMLRYQDRKYNSHFEPRIRL